MLIGTLIRFTTYRNIKDPKYPHQKIQNCFKGAYAAEYLGGVQSDEGLNKGYYIPWGQLNADSTYLYSSHDHLLFYFLLNLCIDLCIFAIYTSIEGY